MSSGSARIALSLIVLAGCSRSAVLSPYAAVASPASGGRAGGAGILNNGAAGRGFSSAGRDAPVASAGRAPSSLPDSGPIGTGGLGASGGAPAADAGRTNPGVAGAAPPDAGRKPQGPLWRMSFDALCLPGDPPVRSASVWSEPSAVYLLASGDDGETIHVNRGSGWELLYKQPSSAPLTRITGFPGGPLVRYGAFPCAIQNVADGQSRCSAAISEANDVFFVASDRAYAVYSDRVLQLEGDRWVQLGDALPLSTARAVWSDGDRLAVAGSDGSLMRGTPDRLEADASAPAGNYLALYGAGTELWAGLRDGSIRRFDGSKWSTPWQSSSECARGVRGLWSDGATLYFHTANEFGVLRDGVPEIIQEFACDSAVELAGVWGNDASEVFIAAVDPMHALSDCGGAVALRLDQDALVRF